MIPDTLLLSETYYTNETLYLPWLSNYLPPPGGFTCPTNSPETTGGIGGPGLNSKAKPQFSAPPPAVLPVQETLLKPRGEVI